MTVLIAGGGICGLTMALTCHEIGVPVKVFESARKLEPLGVGINLQPNAVRELIDLGLGDGLPAVGLQADEWALVGRNGNDVWAEPRGLDAGYRWPQYAVHRGLFQMLLYREVIDRLGPDAVMTGHRVVGYENRSGAVSATIERRGGGTVTEEGAILIGADGLHSAVRTQMAPDEGPPRWAGAVMWRGTTRGRPIRTGAGFTLVGNLHQRFVHYPISAADPETGLQTHNWIAELTFDTDDDSWGDGDWNKKVHIEKFIDEFEEWNFEWLDIPAVIRGADEVFEYPMVDRDPIDHWVDGRTALMGDAAHVMYPVGSNGASQAIVDARVLGAKMVEHGVGREALLAYEAALHHDVSSLVLRNRGAGPVAILGEVDARCGGVFDDIEDVISREEIEEFMASYKAAAGFAIETLNSQPPTIAPGSAIPGG